MVEDRPGAAGDGAVVEARVLYHLEQVDADLAEFLDLIHTLASVLWLGTTGTPGCASASAFRGNSPRVLPSLAGTRTGHWSLPRPCRARCRSCAARSWTRRRRGR